MSDKPEIDRRKFGVYLDKPGFPPELELVRAFTPEAAAEVVRVLLATGDRELIAVKVVVSTL